MHTTSCCRADKQSGGVGRQLSCEPHSWPGMRRFWGCRRCRWRHPTHVEGKGLWCLLLAAPVIPQCLGLHLCRVMACSQSHVVFGCRLASYSVVDMSTCNLPRLLADALQVARQP
jgi:hypothetical protein